MKSFKFILFVSISLLCLLFVVVTTLDEYYSPKEDKKEIIDSVNSHSDSLKTNLDYPLNKISLGIDSVLKQNHTPQIPKTETSKKVYSLLNFCEYNNLGNPHIKITSTDSFVFVLGLCNVGNIPITHLIEKIRCVTIIDENPVLVDDIISPSAFNKYLTINPQMAYELNIPLNCTRKEKANSKDFICIKIIYQDVNKKDSLVRAYQIESPMYNSEIKMANSIEMDLIENLLVKNAIW